MKVFLGGTCGKSVWREELLKSLNAIEGHSIECFYPVVTSWTPECQKEERKQRVKSDFVLYVLTPDMEGCYSIAEVVDDSNKRPYRTLLSIIYEGVDGSVFSNSMLKSLEVTKEIVIANEATVLEWEDIVSFLVTTDKRRKESSIRRREKVCSMCMYNACRKICTKEETLTCKLCSCKFCVDDDMEGFEEVYCGDEDE